jgi:hypothetical protein
MDRKIESELFDRLFRERRLTEWLREQLDAQVKVLMVNPDVEQLRKAQGAAQVITAFLDKLTAAESAAKR